MSADRMPPHDLLAEQSALGGMMLTRSVVDDVMGEARPADFYFPKHERVCQAIYDLHGRGEPTDVVAVGDELRRTRKLTEAGGMEYLHTLTSIPTTSVNAGYHAAIVAAKGVLRRLAEAGMRITDKGFASEGEPLELVIQAQHELDRVLGTQRREVRMTHETLLGTIDSLDKDVVQVETPWRQLNNAIGGFRPGGLYVFGARPAVGKSAIALQAAAVLARQGAVAYCSLEMDERELHLRMMAQGATVPFESLMHPKTRLTQAMHERIARWRSRAPLSIAIDDRSSLSVFDVRAFAHAVHKRQPLAAVVVDYLQLMSDPRDLPRHEKVADMSRQLKILAREMQIPVIALSQLNRGPEARADKRPQLSDLRESGAIEQDADVVVLLHRDTTPARREDDELEMFVAKNRQGPAGVARTQWQGEYVRAVDADRPGPPAIAPEPQLDLEGAP